MHVSISKGNSKMGAIASVSLPAISTCAPCDCRRKCYAHKLERLRPSVRDAYRNNYDILKSDPEQYWNEVESAIKLSRFFRFHVSGDIPDLPYLGNMITVASKNPHCEMLCFTKRYSFVNFVLDSGAKLPNNLHIILSAWPGKLMENPFELPEAHVLFRDKTTTARSDAKKCLGNCTECAVTDSGCWTLKSGEQILFNEH